MAADVVTTCHFNWDAYNRRAPRSEVIVELVTAVASRPTLSRLQVSRGKDAASVYGLRVDFIDQLSPHPVPTYHRALTVIAVQPHKATPDNGA